jgi:hypothetical protein
MKIFLNSFVNVVEVVQGIFRLVILTHKRENIMRGRERSEK